VKVITVAIQCTKITVARLCSALKNYCGYAVH